MPDLQPSEFYKVMREFVADMENRIAKEVRLPTGEFYNYITDPGNGTSAALEVLRKTMRDLEFRKALIEQITAGRGIDVIPSHFAPKDKCAFYCPEPFADYVIICNADIEAEVRLTIAKVVQELTSEPT